MRTVAAWARSGVCRDVQLNRTRHPYSTGGWATAMDRIRRLAYAGLDGTLIPIDRLPTRNRLLGET